MVSLDIPAVLHPELNRFDQLFAEARWAETSPGHGWVFCSTYHLAAPTVKKKRPMIHLWVVPNSLTHVAIDRQLTGNPSERPLFKIITQWGTTPERTGKTLVLACGSMLSSSTWVAYIDPATVGEITYAAVEPEPNEAERILKTLDSVDEIDYTKEEGNTK